MTKGKTLVFKFSGVEVREREFSLVRDGAVIAVEPKAFRVLLYLLQHPQKLISKEELLNAVWGDASVTENSLTQNIAKLRRLLEDDVREPRFIATVATVGYRLVCDVEVIEEAPEAEELIARQNGHRKSGLIDASPNGAVRDSIAEPPPQGERTLDPATNHENPRIPVHRKFLRRLLACAAVLAVILGATIWYLRRPLPPPRITAYTRITRDGGAKNVAGTDGTRLLVNMFPWAFLNLVEANGRAFIYQVGVNGGDMVPLPVAVPGAVPAVLGISQDGSHLLVGAGEAGKSAPAIWNVQILGGGYRRLGSGWNATFSPDGGTVAFTSPETDLWLVQSDGTGAHKLLAGPVGRPAWSPDGRTIRFGRAFWSGAEASLWEISSDGSNLHQLLQGFHTSGWLRRGNWTPDSKFYVFRSSPDRGTEGEQLWALDERRGLLRQAPAEPIQLTSGPLSWSDPIPSKDGKRIFATGSTTSGELVRIDPVTKAITPFLGGISAFDVTFSKDGKFVAYISFPDGNLWRANRDGSNPVQLTHPPLSPWFPRWSPDGSMILFAERSKDHTVAYTVPAEGGIPHQVPPVQAGEEGGPVGWSPDGRKMLIGTGGWRESNSAVKIFDIASRTLAPVPGSIGTMFHLWSPNGRFITAISYGQTALKIFNVERKEWSTIPVKGQVGYTVISGDSRWIYFELFDKNDPGNGRIYRVPVKGGGMELVADLKGWRFARIPGDWMDLDPDGGLLLMRDTGAADVYALTLEEK